MLLMDGEKLRGKRYAKVYYSSDYGVKVDIDHLIAKIIMVVSRGSMRVIYSDIKKYMELALPEEQVNLMKQEHDAVNLMKSMMALRYVSLGKASMHGVDVEGIEVADEPFKKELYDRCTARLWVSVKSGLPVLFEIRGMSGHVEITTRFENFAWNTTLAENFFEADINNEYTLTAQVNEPPMNEETAVQFCAALQVSTAAAIRAASGASTMKTSSTKYSSAGQMKSAARTAGCCILRRMILTGKELGSCALNGTVSQFYGKLARDGRDAAYYGDRVTPDMPDKPLLRWKVSDKQYRVIWVICM